LTINENFRGKSLSQTEFEDQEFFLTFLDEEEPYTKEIDMFKHL